MGVDILFAMIAAFVLFLWLAWDDMGDLFKGKTVDNNGLSIIVLIVVTTLSVILLIVFGVK